LPLDSELIEQIRRVLNAVEQILPRPVPDTDWAVHHAAAWRRRPLAGWLEPLSSQGGPGLEDLLGIDEQKAVVEQNVRQFLAGLPANNVLLWGVRGTGKSSLVRALLAAHAPRGLRLVQVDKADLVMLHDIVDGLRDQPYRFILFADDVSFEPGESSYKALKSALDGSVYAVPENVLIHVTSNRRHLLPEFETDNRGALMVNDEIHHGEAIEEKISLSGRFGLWVGFHSFSTEQYLAVVRQWIDRMCAARGTSLPWDGRSRDAAIAWTHRKGDASGRIAWQFAAHWVGSELLARPTPSRRPGS
jgi:predicted AAA+ superfamily ATPase